MKIVIYKKVFFGGKSTYVFDSGAHGGVVVFKLILCYLQQKEKIKYNCTKSFFAVKKIAISVYVGTILPFRLPAFPRP